MHRIASVEQSFGDPADYVLRIGDDGIPMARWLRDHSEVDDVAATNAHCELIDSDPCIARAFWMSAYSERQFLVEGWSYVAWTNVGLTSPEPDNTVSGPFWDPPRLAANDAAFTDPSAATVSTLADEYDVRWLVVDRRFPGTDVGGLEAVADLRYDEGDYQVFELR